MRFNALNIFHADYILDSWWGDAHSSKKASGRPRGSRGRGHSGISSCFAFSRFVDCSSAELAFLSRADVLHKWLAVLVTAHYTHRRTVYCDGASRDDGVPQAWQAQFPGLPDMSQSRGVGRATSSAWSPSSPRVRSLFLIRPVFDHVLADIHCVKEIRYTDTQKPNGSGAVQTNLNHVWATLPGYVLQSAWPELQSRRNSFKRQLQQLIVDRDQAQQARIDAGQKGKERKKQQQKQQQEQGGGVKQEATDSLDDEEEVLEMELNDRLESKVSTMSAAEDPLVAALTAGSSSGRRDRLVTADPTLIATRWSSLLRLVTVSTEGNKETHHVTHLAVVQFIHGCIVVCSGVHAAPIVPYMSGHDYMSGWDRMLCNGWQRTVLLGEECFGTQRVLRAKR